MRWKKCKVISIYDISELYLNLLQFIQYSIARLLEYAIYTRVLQGLTQLLVSAIIHLLFL